MRRLWRASIWHPTAIPKVEWKYASPLKRVLFPVYDLAVIWLGVFGLLVGFRAVRAAFPEPGPAIFYGALLAAGVVCLVGCAFPRLWLAEIIGKSVILIILAVVLIAMVNAATTLSGYAGLTVVPVMVVMMMPPSLRLWLLGVEIAGRRTSTEGDAWNG